MKSGAGLSSVYGLLMIMAIGFFISTFFISFHGDLAEGVMVALFLEERLSKQLIKPPESVKKVYQDDIANIYKDEGLGSLLCGGCSSGAAE